MTFHFVQLKVTDFLPKLPWMVFLWILTDLNKYRKPKKQPEFKLPSKARIPHYQWASACQRLVWSLTQQQLFPGCLASGGPLKKRSSNSINSIFHREKCKHWRIKRPSWRSHEGPWETQNSKTFPESCKGCWDWDPRLSLGWGLLHPCGRWSLYH